MKYYFLILLLIICSCFKRKTPEIYLIPDGYQGPIIVVFEQSGGQNEELEKNKRVYRIDKNGLLLSKFKNEPGVLNQEYYYIRSDGSRQRVDLDSTIFFTDSIKIKNYRKETENKILIGKFGIAGAYMNYRFAESVIGTRKFLDSTNLERMKDLQWRILQWENK